jgi:uncharacterized membrane protein YccC
MSTVEPSTRPDLGLAIARALADWRRSELPKWLYVFRTLAAGLTALWIAYRLGFSSPSTALLTVFIVSVPQAGQVLAKSFYRVLGTLAGAVVAVLLVGTLVQQRDLFVLLLAGWLGLCTFGAAYFRGFQAYAFVLAGYSAAIIAIPSLESVPQIFDVALFRVSEVLLGILCAGVYADLLFPTRTSELLVHAVRGSYARFIDYLQKARNRELDRIGLQDANLAFIGDALQFEALRESSFFENPEARVRSDRLRLFNADFMRTGTAFHGYYAMINRLRRRGDEALADRLREFGTALLAAVRLEGRVPATAAEARRALAQLVAFRERLPALMRAGRIAVQNEAEAATRVIEFDTLGRQFARLVEQLVQFTEAYAALEQLRGRAPHVAPRFFPHTEPLGAAIMGLRTFLTVLLMAAFWIATAWPAGGGAMLISGVICALFAAAPRPEAAARTLLIGFVLALPSAALFQFGVLPRLDGFVLFCAAVAPVLMASTYAMATPSVAGIGLGFNLMFLTLTGFSNLTLFNPTALLNNGIGQILGVAVALLMFSVLIPSRPAWFARRLRRALRLHAATACRSPLAGLRARFESRTRDLLIQLISRADRSQDEHRAQLALALALLDLGDAVIHLRRAARDVAGLHARDISELPNTLRAVERLLRQPAPAHRDAARRALQSDLDHWYALLTAGDHHAATDDPRWRLHTDWVRMLSIVDDDSWYADLARDVDTAPPAAAVAGVPTDAA